MKTAFKNTDDYIKSFPEEIQILLDKIRATIKDAAPGAEEIISYRMPAFKLNGMLVWFAAYKNHIGFYPTASGIVKFKKEISSYKWAKGSVQFPLQKPIPYTLIRKIVKFKMKENLEKEKTRKRKTLKN